MNREQKKQADKLAKKKRVTPSWCGKCLGDLDLRYTPVSKKGAGKGYTIVYGICEKCQLVLVLHILKPKQMFAVDYIPKEDRYKYKTSTSKPPIKNKR